jgi:hypothetical protein
MEIDNMVCINNNAENDYDFFADTFTSFNNAVLTFDEYDDLYFPMNDEKKEQDDNMDLNIISSDEEEEEEDDYEHKHQRKRQRKNEDNCEQEEDDKVDLNGEESEEVDLNQEDDDDDYEMEQYNDEMLQLDFGFEVCNDIVTREYSSSFDGGSIAAAAAAADGGVGGVCGNDLSRRQKAKKEKEIQFTNVNVNIRQLIEKKKNTCKDHCDICNTKTYRPNRLLTCGHRVCSSCEKRAIFNTIHEFGVYHTFSHGIQCIYGYMDNSPKCKVFTRFFDSILDPHKIFKQWNAARFRFCFKCLSSTKAPLRSYSVEEYQSVKSFKVVLCAICMDIVPIEEKKFIATNIIPTVKSQFIVYTSQKNKKAQRRIAETPF